MRYLLLLPLLGFLATPLQAAYLYKAMFVRAAPGRLANLIEMYRKRMEVYAAAGDERPFWMRHSQGDQWDLLMLFPMESFSAYYSPEREKRRREAGKHSGIPQPQFARQFYQNVAWHEDLYVEGPDLAQVRRAFAGAHFFHVEAFLALPGRQEDLYRERRMENRYLAALGRPQNLIFRHEQGAAWDLFTIGCYRDLLHFAESARIPAEREEKAAREAGFEGAGTIGLYLRSLITSHHDTLAVALPEIR